MKFCTNLIGFNEKDTEFKDIKFMNCLKVIKIVKVIKIQRQRKTKGD